MHKKAFTLVELLVVIAIIAILAAMLLPIISSLTGQTRYTIQILTPNGGTFTNAVLIYQNRDSVKFRVNGVQYEINGPYLIKKEPKNEHSTKAEDN